MLLKLFLILSVVLWCEANVYSSFWAPLFNRTILNYRVDVPFEASAGLSAREQYEKQYGYRGRKLIEDLGAGRPPLEYSNPVNKVYGDVKIQYT